VSSIGVWLRQARERRDTTEAELAKHLGTEQSMLAMIEKGEAKPSRELEAKIKAWIRGGAHISSRRGAYDK